MSILRQPHFLAHSEKQIIKADTLTSISYPLFWSQHPVDFRVQRYELFLNRQKKVSFSTSFSFSNPRFSRPGDRAGKFFLHCRSASCEIFKKNIWPCRKMVVLLRCQTTNRRGATKDGCPRNQRRAFFMPLRNRQANNESGCLTPCSGCNGPGDSSSKVV